MTTKAYVELDRELEQYLRLLLGGLGRPERVEALGWYTAGLLLAGEHKSIAPIAARLSPDPEAAEAIRQRLQQAVVVAKWDPQVLWKLMNQHLLSELGSMEALIGDECAAAFRPCWCAGSACVRCAVAASTLTRPLQEFLGCEQVVIASCWLGHHDGLLRSPSGTDSSSRRDLRWIAKSHFFTSFHCLGSHS